VTNVHPLGLRATAASRTGTSSPSARASTGDELRRYGRLIWRHRALILVCLVVAVSGAAVFTVAESPTYSATSTLIIQQTAGEKVVDPESLTSRDSQRRIDTEIEVLRSTSVMDEATRQLGHRPRIRAVAVGQTDTIQVIASSADSATAAGDSNGYAEAYVALSRARASSDLETSRAEAQAKIDEISLRLGELDTKLADIEGALEGADPAQKSLLQAQRRDLLSERTAQTDQRAYFAQQRDRLQVASNFASRGGAQIIGRAQAPANPISPSLPRNVGVAAALGLLLGAVMAFVRENLDDRIKLKGDVERIDPQLPVIGLIPLQHKANGGKPASSSSSISTRLVSIADPHSAIAEAYRMVRASLQFMDLGGHAIRVLQVTSAEPSDGKTTAVANLAACFARNGQRVVVVCCDWRKPRLHDCFNLSNRVGFTSVLLGEVSLEEAIQQVPGRDNLVVLASGPPPPNPAELLGSQQTSAIVRALRDVADIVIIDTPPVLPVSDAMVLAPLADATLLVAQSNKTSRKGVRRALELLRQVDAPLIGTVLVGVTGDEAYVALYQGYGYNSAAARGRRAAHDVANDLPSRRPGPLADVGATPGPSSADGTGVL